MVAILGSDLPVTWVQSIAIEKPVVKSIGFGFGMVFLSSLQAEIYVFPV